MESGSMQASSTLLQGRRLLSDCTVIGSVGVGGSVALLLLVGFVVGAGASWLFFWVRERRRMRIELEYRDRYGDAVRSGLPDVAALVKAAHTPTISRNAADVTALTGGAELARDASKGPGPQDGPLAMGAVSSFKQQQEEESLRQAMSNKEQQHANHHSNPLAAGAAASDGASMAMARSSSGNPFTTEVPGFRLRTNEVCSLNNTPSPPSARGRPGSAGLIGAGFYGPAADPASPRITKPTPAAEPAPRQAAAHQAAASPFAWPSIDGHPTVGQQQPVQQQQPQAQPQQQAFHARSGTVVVKPGASAAPAAAAAPSGSAGASVSAEGSGDYLAALDSTSTNPFETPALRRQQEEEGGAAAFANRAAAAAPPAAHTAANDQAGGSAGAAVGAQGGQSAKTAQKKELLQQVQGDEYGDEELDPEWASLLGELDGRLQASGRPTLSDKERAVAIRSLIVATTNQSADAALGKAQHDVESFRRAQAFRNAAA